MKQSVHHDQIGLAEFFRNGPVELTKVKAPKLAEMPSSKIDVAPIDIKAVIVHRLIQILQDMTRTTADIVDGCPRRNLRHVVAHRLQARAEKAAPLLEFLVDGR